MPNRILKDSICASENIDQLSPGEEVFFYRLIVNCDDYGRMDARPKLLASRLFPLKDLTLDDIQSCLDALVNADLISIYEVSGHHYLQMKTWDKHQQVRAKKSKYPSPSDSNCNHLISDAIKCPRNPIQSNPNPNPNPNPIQLMDDEDAQKIQREQDRVLDAAEDAGFQMSNDVRASLIALYAEHGSQKILNGLKSCVEHGATNLAYLKACLSGKERKKPESSTHAKTVVAQQYEQRTYEDEDGEAMRRMIAMMNAQEGA